VFYQRKVITADTKRQEMPSYGNSKDAPLPTNGLRKCIIYTQWNFIQPQRRMKFCHSQVMELENIILSEVSQVQKTKNRMFSLICGL
jgi:hypothetical protein